MHGEYRVRRGETSRTFTVRLPGPLYQELARVAEARRKTIGAVLTELLEEGVKAARHAYARELAQEYRLAQLRGEDPEN